MHKLLEEKLLPVICSVGFGNWEEVMDGEWWPNVVYMSEVLAAELSAK
jgi:hypothetical protein